ncbi:TonB-dependent copper receptor [Pseudomonas sp.]|uniref:TonB-dependent copper receptor n=1 Tax=Pseudomonas sp. TaxID=306 RepID=UPI00272A1D11|nr:TonB-dependent copper receptor [Pseudomonas sp.]
MTDTLRTGGVRARLRRRFSRKTAFQLRFQLGHAALLGVLSVNAIAAELDREQPLGLAPLIITGIVAQQSPLIISTDPTIPRQPIPASDAGDYLQTIPGFSAIRGSGSNSDPVFRGMFGSRLRLLSNGTEMLGACPTRMDAPSSYITPENFDRLTVIKGPQTVLWGPGNSAATVLFERDPETFGELGGRVDASALVGSVGRLDRNLDAATGSAQGYARVLANHAEANDYRDGNGDRVHSAWDKWSADLALGWTPDLDTLLELTLGRGDGEARYAGRAMDGSQFLRESAALRMERENMGEHWQKLEARVYYNYADHTMDNYSLRLPSGTGMMGNPMASNVDRRTLGLRLAGTWRWSDLELLGGADAQRNEHRRRRSQFSTVTGQLTPADAFPWDKDAEFSSHGLFAELTRALENGSKLVGGARIDRTTVRDRRTTGTTAGDSRNETLPAGFIRYEHALTSLPANAYFGLGHTQRFPDYWELFSGGPLAFAQIEPERTTQLDAGLQYRQGPLEAWLSVYGGEVRDFILFEYSTNMMGMPSATAVNVDAHILGGEVGAAYRLSDAWRTETSLAYAWGRNRTDGEPLPQIPPLDARLNLTYEQNRWSASGLWRVVAAQTRVAEGKGQVASRDFDESAGFGVLAVNAAYAFSPRVKLSTGIDNLLDKAYGEHLNLAGNAGVGLSSTDRINEPGRTYWARIDLRF